MTSTKPHTHKPNFSFEILPPLRGKGMKSVYDTIDRLMQFNPAYINITTHRSETFYSEESDGTFRKLSVRNRPGTVAIAAALKERYGIRTVPHIICSGFTAAEIESELIDLSYLDITELLLLRGDRAHGENRYTPMPGGHTHAIELIDQVNNFNKGVLLGNVKSEPLEHAFTFGVAGYPEKHEEAMNLDLDIQHLKEKVEAGAKYVVTQMFFDNQRYFDFVSRLRKAGIDVPVIPGLKPLTTLNHCTMLPRTFHIDFPEQLAKELTLCRNNDDVKSVGVDWAKQQCRELREAGVEGIHFYTMNAAQMVERIMTE